MLMLLLLSIQNYDNLLNDPIDRRSIDMIRQAEIAQAEVAHRHCCCCCCCCCSFAAAVAATADQSTVVAVAIATDQSTTVVTDASDPES